MITQPLEWDYDRSLLVCKACRGDASNTEMPHRDDCPWVAGLVAAAVDAERERIAKLADEVSARYPLTPPGGGPVLTWRVFAGLIREPS